jgi:hypothetical protein
LSLHHFSDRVIYYQSGYLFFPSFSAIFFAGIVYAQIFKIYAEYSFKLYASDLAGDAVGSFASLGSFSLFGASNSILILAVIILGLSASFMSGWISKKKIIVFSLILSLSFIALLVNGKTEFLGRVPIGNFIEKYFYHVYPNLNFQSQIIDSCWSMYDRSDLVQYSHQDEVKQLFKDIFLGCTGSTVLCLFWVLCLLLFCR